MTIQRHTDLNHKRINYRKPEKQGLVYYSAIDYNNEPFYLQTPKMICKKNGIEIIESKNNIMDMETINVDYSFYDSFVNLDELNVKKTFSANKEWFGKDIPLDVIDNMYKRLNKPVKKNSQPIFGFKVPMIKGKVQCQIYDQKQTCIDLNQLKEGTEVVCILHLRGLKFLKQHYYCDVYISQIKVFLEGDNKFSILDSYSFNDVDEETNEMKQLEKDLMLDEDFLNSLQTNKIDKQNVETELFNSRKILKEHTTIIENLEKKLSQLN